MNFIKMVFFGQYLLQFIYLQKLQYFHLEKAAQCVIISYCLYFKPDYTIDKCEVIYEGRY